MTISRTRVRPHGFVDDPALVDDYVSVERRAAGLGPRRWCARCGLPGERGDVRHPYAAEAAEQLHLRVLAEASALDARILGEHHHGDEEDLVLTGSQSGLGTPPQAGGGSGW